MKKQLIITTCDIWKTNRQVTYNLKQPINSEIDFGESHDLVESGDIGESGEFGESDNSSPGLGPVYGQSWVIPCHNRSWFLNSHQHSVSHTISASFI